MLSVKEDILFFFLVGLGFALAKQVLYCLSHTPLVHFALVILEMESYELFALDPPDVSLPNRLGLRACANGIQPWWIF
jgi:hypothetical protein